MKLFRKPSASRPMSEAGGTLPPPSSVCDECSKSASEVFCQQCEAHLCAACDGQVHSSRVTRTHIRSPEGKKPKPLPPPPSAAGLLSSSSSSNTPKESPEQVAKAKAALAEVEDALKREEAFQADLGEALRGARAAMEQHFAQLSQALAQREKQLASELAEMERSAAQRRTALIEAKQQLGTPGVRSTENTLAAAAAAVSHVPKSCGVVFVADPSASDVEKTISAFGRFALGRGRDYTTTLKAPKRVFGNSGKGGLTFFDSPRFIRRDASDNILLLDSGNSRVLVFKPNGAPIREFVPPEGHLSGLGLDPSGNIVLVHGFLRKVRVYGPDGSQMLEFGTLQRSHCDIPGEFRSPEGIVIDSAGRFLVVDKEKSRVSVFEPNGNFLTAIGYSSGSKPGQFQFPESATLTPSGDIIVVDHYNHRLQIFSGEDWSLIGEFGSEGSGPGQFYYPRDAAVDAIGNVIVADTGNNRVVICAPDGKFIASFGTRGDGPGQFDQPFSVAVNSDGQIIVLDRGNCRVQIW